MLKCVWRSPDNTTSNKETDLYVGLLKYHTPAVEYASMEEPTNTTLKHGIMDFVGLGPVGETENSEVFYIGRWNEVSVDDEFICQKVLFWMKYLHCTRGNKVEEFAKLVPEELLIEHAKETGQRYIQ